MAWSEDDDIALGGYADSNDVGGILRDYSGRIASHYGGDVSIQYKPDGSSVLNVIGEDGKIISSSPTDIDSLKTYIPTVFTKAIQPERVIQQTPRAQAAQRQSGMNMQGLDGLLGGNTKQVGEVTVPADYELGTGTIGNKYAASQGYEPLDYASYNNVAGTIDDAGGIESVGGGGDAGFDVGGGWMSAAGGALNGYMQGRKNYEEDPNMWSGKDGYGKYHKDYRAEVGGGFLGGVMGYYGGPVGAALAGPVTKAVHPYAEKGTREVINFGDKVGGAGGALALDPIGTVSTGKYSWGEIGRGALLGPLDKLFK